MRIAILGNSGSGKTTLAHSIARRTATPLLDLDTVAWEPDQIAVARSARDAERDVQAFCGSHESWVVEGCYANLVRAALAFSPRLICVANCRARPWEPHKCSSKAEQDERLQFLLAWVGQYYSREGEMSLSSHAALFADYAGQKNELTSMPMLEPASAELVAWTRELQT
jgi:adenylate kinase family enzyme